MLQLLNEQTYTATTTTGNLSLARFRRRKILMLWQFELNGGSGSNSITITPKVAANWEDDVATEEVFDIDHLSEWVGPRVIDDTSISAASSSVLKLSYIVPNLYEFFRLTFTYAGGGTRGFKVNLWAG